MTNPARMPAELAARITAAQAVLQDFDRDARDTEEPLSNIDWESWALRMGAELTGLTGWVAYTAARNPEPFRPVVTSVLPDGSAWLAPADLLIVLGALDEAADLADTDAWAAYRSLSRALGDDR